MKKLFGIAIVLTGFIANLTAQNAYRPPRALIITCGADQGRGTLPDGVVLALQDMNSAGVRVYVHDRSILLQPEALKNYDWLFLPTVSGYRDELRPPSPTRLSDTEWRLIKNWVREGGWLITDTRAGRNLPDGTDRYVLKLQEHISLMPLEELSGAYLRETNIKGMRLIAKDDFPWRRPRDFDKNEWMLVADSLSPDTEVFAEWTARRSHHPAAWLHRYGKGYVFMLPHYGLLHPDFDGGLARVDEISAFYRKLLGLYLREIRNPVSLTPWPEGREAAFCLTFDDGGTSDQYERILQFVAQENIPTVFFVTASVNPLIRKRLMSNPKIRLQNHSFSHPDFRKLNYYAAYTQIIENELEWNIDFDGFRFPFVSNSFWGLYWLDKSEYLYDSSIAAVDEGFIRGAAVPYHLPIRKDRMFLTLRTLEISQIYRSDWYFFGKIPAVLQSAELQRSQAQRFGRYLINYYENFVRPSAGVMVYLGHPMYSGFNEITMQPLEHLIRHLRSRNVWFTTPGEIARRWNLLKDLSVRITEFSDKILIRANSPSGPIKDLTFKLPFRYRKITSTVPYRLKRRNGISFLVIDLRDTAEISVFLSE